MVDAINKELKEVLDNEIAEDIKKMMRISIETEVYNKYTPTQYIRTKKLLNDIRIDKSSMPQGVVIAPHRMARNGRNIVESVTEGGLDSYTYPTSKYRRNYPMYTEQDWKRLYAYLRPRPFIEKTYQFFARNDIINEMMKQYLILRGILVE